MRSVLFLVASMVIVVSLLLSGNSPRQAGATTGDTTAKHAPRLEMRYADYESEPPLVVRNPGYTPPPPARPEPPAPARRPDPGFGSEAPSPSHEPPPDVDPAAGDPPTVLADAGPDRTVWFGRNEIPLDGSASTGDGLRFSWRQTAGSPTLEIRDPTQAKTTAVGCALPDANALEDVRYEFELTVTDVRGVQSSATVQYTVRVAPEISILPRAKRQLAYRDGYLLAHFESWKTSSAASVESFELRAPGELFIHQLGGQGNYEISVSERAGMYTYKILVYYQEAQSTTWLEFFVDTSDRIPAVVQLGVTWE